MGLDQSASVHDDCQSASERTNSCQNNLSILVHFCYYEQYKHLLRKRLEELEGYLRVYLTFKEK